MKNDWFLMEGLHNPEIDCIHYTAIYDVNTLPIRFLFSQFCLEQFFVQLQPDKIFAENFFSLIFF
jgi:hypothetical protein